MKTNSFDESALSKGELRKLTALRKSLGDKIANDAFAKWLSEQVEAPESEDKNAIAIREALESLVEKKNLHFPRGGYLIRRGRGRVIVEAVGS